MTWKAQAISSIAFQSIGSSLQPELLFKGPRNWRERRSGRRGQAILSKQDRGSEKKIYECFDWITYQYLHAVIDRVRYKT